MEIKRISFDDNRWRTIVSTVRVYEEMLKRGLKKLGLPSYIYFDACYKLSELVRGLWRKLEDDSSDSWEFNEDEEEFIEGMICALLDEGTVPAKKCADVVKDFFCFAFEEYPDKKPLIHYNTKDPRFLD